MRTKSDQEYIKGLLDQQVKDFQCIKELHRENKRLREAIQFYLDLSKTGRVEPDNILEKFAYIQKANDRFKKALEEK